MIVSKTTQSYTIKGFLGFSVSKNKNKTLTGEILKI